jgi:hypothetical protein
MLVPGFGKKKIFKKRIRNLEFKNEGKAIHPLNFMQHFIFYILNTSVTQDISLFPLFLSDS